MNIKNTPLKRKYVDVFRIFNYAKLLTIILIAILFVACQQQVEIGTPAATVNGEVLTLEELKGAYTEEAWNEMSREEQRTIINQWIELTLLAQYARRNEAIKSDVGLGFISNNAQKRIFSNALIANELQNLYISNDDKYNYYRLRQADFIEPIREFRVQRIFFRNEEDMIRVNDMITNGEITYTPAAERFSEEGIGRNGGHMTALVTRSGPDSLMWRELNGVDRFHRITMPYRNGWLIARWGDYRMATGSRSFFDVREEIEQILRSDRKTDLYEQLLREARMMSNVTIEL